jgi:tRNA(fMet)-specific endonuclease VapC
MYILDTDTLSLVHTGNETVSRRKDDVDPGEIATTIVTKVEILQARHDYLLKAADGQHVLRAQNWLQRSEELLEQIIVIPFDQSAATEFDQLRKQRKLKKLGRADLFIASITLAHRATLVTRNLKHFRQIPNLQLENWAD